MQIDEYLGSVLGRPGGVQLLPQEDERIGDADAHKRCAKSYAKQLGAIAQDGAPALRRGEGLIALRHALEGILWAIRKEARQPGLGGPAPRPAWALRQSVFAQAEM